MRYHFEDVQQVALTLKMKPIGEGAQWVGGSIVTGPVAFGRRTAVQPQ